MPAHTGIEGDSVIGSSNRSAGRLPPYLEHARVKEDICITGISGRSGSNRDIEEFKQMLLNGEDGFKMMFPRFNQEKYNCYAKHAYTTDLDKFDWEFFSLPKVNADFTDPQLRCLLESAYEALVDAGLSLKDVKGTKTGVYVNCVHNEAGNAWLNINGGKYDATTVVKVGMGTASTFKSGRISHFLDLKGPSIMNDTACSSFFTCLDFAYSHLRAGVIDMAVIGGANFAMMADISVFFKELGVTGPSGNCYSFDSRAEGFARSECVGAVWLQRESDSKRVYAKVVHTLQACDGYDEDHDFGHPSMPGQVALLKDIYRDTEIDPKQIKFVECHGTGTNAGDPTEVGGLEQVFCGKGRTEPLLVGSVKSNLGHAEGMSGFNSLAKMIVAYENQVLPANINFENPNPNIPALIEGRVKVVTEPTPWSCDYSSICSYGMAGTDAHTILKANDRPASANHPAKDAPRLFTYGARTEEGLRNILEGVQQNVQSVHFQALLESSANEPLHKMPIRGFTVLNTGTPSTTVQKAVKRPLVYVFTGMGAQWNNMAKNMFQIQVFRDSVKKLCEAGKKYWDDNLYEKLVNGLDVNKENRMTVSLALMVVQVALVDVLNALGVEPDYICGHSLGEVAAGYADGCLTAEAAYAVTYLRLVATELPEIDGKMAAVGMTIEDLRAILHPEVDVACHNSVDNCTISGPHGPMDEMIAKLKSLGIFVRDVPSVGKSSHSRACMAAAPELRRTLPQHITPKQRTPRWLSSSFPKSMWDEDICKTCSSEYYIRNLTNTVHFYDVMQELPKDSLAVEISVHGLLQSLVKGTVGPDALVTCAMRRNKDNNLQTFFELLGTMYMNGVDMKPLKMFPEVKFPAPRGTPMIGPYIRKQWNHEDSLPVPVDSETSEITDTYNWELDFSEDSPDRYLLGHRVNDMMVLPATGYLMFVWEAFAAKRDTSFEKCPVVFEDVRFSAATRLPEQGTLTLQCQVLKSGNFEISVGKTIAATGRVRAASEAQDVVQQLTSLDSVTRSKKTSYKRTIPETQRDIYLSLAQSGFTYEGMYRSIVSTDRYETKVEFPGQWVAFLDCLMQAMILSGHSDMFAMPFHFDTVYLDASKISKQLESGVEKPVETVWMDPETGHLSSDSMNFQGLTPSMMEKNIPKETLLMDEYRFVPFLEDTPEVFEKSLHEYANTCAQYTAAALKELLRSNPNAVPASTKKILDSKLATLRTLTMSGLQTAIDQYQTQENTGLSQVLRQLFTSPFNSEDASTILVSNLPELCDDRLLDALSRPDILASPMDVLYLNILPKFTVLELSADNARFYRHITPYLACYTGITYQALYDTVEPEDCEAFEATPVAWTPGSGEPLPNIKPHLLVMKNVLHKQADPLAFFNEVSAVVPPGGYILVQEVTHNFVIQAALEGLVQDLEIPNAVGPREFGRFMTDSSWQALFAKTDLDLVYRKSDNLLSTLYMLKKKVDMPLKPRFVRFGNVEGDWVERVRDEVQKVVDEEEDTGNRLWLVAEQWNSGAMGFMNALAKEPNGKRIRCICVSNLNEKSKLPDLSDEALKKDIARLDLYMNMYRDGKWGSYGLVTRRKDTTFNFAPSDEVFAHVTSIGSLETVTWLKTHPDLLSLEAAGQAGDTIEVYYAGVNRRDVLHAEGKIRREVDLKRYNCPVMGLEFSGRDSQGKRMAGLCDGLALATKVSKQSALCVDVPDNWTLSQAATVPYAYLATYYALMVKCPLQAGQSILVHDGTCTVGLAAIQTALHIGATVYTTVDSQAKVEFLVKNIPKLQKGHILTSQGLGALSDLAKLTQGRGLDVIVNTDATLDTMDVNILKAIKNSGQLIEVGRLKIGSFHDRFGPLMLRHNIRYFNVDVQDLLNDVTNRDQLTALVNDNLKKNVIKPLSSTIYEAGQLVDAFRSVETGTQPGAVIVKVRAEERRKVCLPTGTSIEAAQRIVCDPKKCYILTGGLGGLGLETAHWLAKRGARNILFTSRSGVKTGYQERKLYILRNYFNARVEVSTRVIKSLEDAKALIKEGQKLGPIGGVFILTMVLKDMVFTSYNYEDFTLVSKTKTNDCIYLDQATRELCGPELDWFSPFSSMGCSKGLASQTAYSFGNASMERVCEKRQHDGLPATAIEIGSIMGVGALEKDATNWLLQEMKFHLYDFVRIDVAINALDVVLRMKDCAVVTLGKKLTGPNSRETVQAKPGLMDAIGKIFGMDLNKLDQDLNLGSMGLDSLMAVELKGTLERDFGTNLDVSDIRKLTIGKLQEMDQEFANS